MSQIESPAAPSAEGTGLVREVEHQIEIDAPADVVHGLIADVTQWPRIFPPTIHVDVLDSDVRDGTGSERIRIWATANGEVKSWTSGRRLERAGRRITFRQEVSTAPVRAMGGTWVIEEPEPGRCLVRLLHDYSAVDDDPQSLAWIDAAVDRNSRSELAALKRNIETTTAADLAFSFVDTVWIDGAVEDVYEFLDRADHWPERLPHVARAELTEDAPGLQILEMDTRTKDGSTHTTKSVRVCFAPDRIVYKQITLPALMTVHTGYWLLEPDGEGTRATSQHTVVLNPETIGPVLGPSADVPAARAFVRTALSTNSSSTLGYAKAHAESLRRAR